MPATTTDPGRPRDRGTVALRAFLALVAANAALGLGVLLAGGVGETGGKILLTSLSVTAGVMLALACSAARATARLGPARQVGMASAALGFGMLVAGIWGDIESGTFLRTAWSLISVCVAVAVISLASLATLPARFQRVFPAVRILTILLLAMLLAAIWGDFEAGWFWRVFGSIAVALTACVIVLPVLARVAAREAREAGTAVGRVAFCPNCGHPVDAPADAVSTCSRCAATFEVRFVPGPGGPAGT